jgi:hypothetical protein
MPSGPTSVRPFPRNQLAMPTPQRVWRRDRGDLPQHGPADAVRPRSQSSAIVIREAESRFPSWHRSSRFSSIS